MTIEDAQAHEAMCTVCAGPVPAPRLFYGSDQCNAGALRNPDRIPISVVFGVPPGRDGVLTVGAEHGDILVHADLVGRPFGALVLTRDNALTLSLWLCAHVIDERHRRQTR